MSPHAAKKRLHMVWGIYASFLLALMVAGFLVLNAFHTSRDRQIASCERGNAIRAQVDDLGQAFADAKVIVADYIVEAARVRVVSGDPKGAAKRRAAALRLLALDVPPLGTLDCDAVIRSR